MQQESTTARPTASSDFSPASTQATIGLSKQAFRDMLAAAARVNQHHTAHLSQRPA